MENTLENKARLFAQYFNQEVRVWKEKPDLLCNVGYAALQKEALPYSHIELTPLSQITDDDAIEVAKYMGWEQPKEREDFREIRDQLIVKIRHNWVTWVCVDYLRSKGYALPYQDAPVEQQIAYGWIKLKPKE